jgi:phage-related minor tail protein
MSNYNDLALRLTQLDAQIKSQHTLGATAIRKQRQAEKKIVALRTQLEDAHEESLKIVAQIGELKRARKAIILELQTRADQVQ